jgi:flagellar basal-body rod protein FlgF
MDNAGYTTLSRQTGLLREMQVVAHNIANASTTGFRREGVTFSEFIRALGDGDDSLSMTVPLVRRIDQSQGVLSLTGSPYDLAIEGPGFFQVETPEGPLLTRAGAFATNAAGEMVTADGRRLLDIGGAPIFVPPDADLAVARDGTVSAGGVALGQVALVVPADPMTLSRRPAGLFAAGAVEPAEGAVVMQGFVERSNVDPIAEIARMIEVQRAYEQGASFLDREDERIRAVIQTLGR